jgi:hypothetical protein
MLKWMTLVIGLIALELGIVVLFEGSQEIAGIVIIAISGLLILVGIGLLLLKKKAKTQKSAPATAEPEEEPPVF